MKRLLFDLKRLIQDNLSRALYMFEVAEGEAHAKELRKMGQTSPAWQGYIDNLHFHQRHIFDLPSLRDRYY